MLVSAAWIVPAVFGAVNEVAQKRLFGGRVSVPELLFASGDWLLYAFSPRRVCHLATLAAGAPAPGAPCRVPFRNVARVLRGLGRRAGTVLRALLMPQNLWGGPAAHFVSWLFITFPFGVAVYLCIAIRN